MGTRVARSVCCSTEATLDVVMQGAAVARARGDAGRAWPPALAASGSARLAGAVADTAALVADHHDGHGGQALHHLGHAIDG